MITLDLIKELLQNSAPLLQNLNETYTLLPPTRCRRQTHCCSLLPQTTWLEALTVIHRLTHMRSSKRRKLLKNIIQYFFLNPVEITSCPFLQGYDCLIYDIRFSGCRTYGLWSEAYYEKIAMQDRQAKLQFQKQWINMGISLPQNIVDFQVPYCGYVEIIDNKSIDDKVLLEVMEKIETLSKRLTHPHQSFQQQYYSDLSFLLSDLVFGFREAVIMKYIVVREMIHTGSRGKLQQIIKNVPDLLAKLV